MFSGRRTIPATKVVLAGALGLGAGMFGPGGAAAAEPTQQEMLEQIKALQAKVQQLENQHKQQGGQPQDRQAGEVTAGRAEQGATVDSVLRDADRRSSPSLLQAGGFTAGYSKNKFLIQDEAGNFVLNPNFQFQTRFVVNSRDVDSDDGENDTGVESGLEIRRMKIAFDGNLFGPALTYKFQWATNRANGQALLEDAWVRYALGDFLGEATKNWAIRFGQFKDPTFHEEITSSKRQLAVDRSLVNEVLAGGLTDYIQGISLIWDDGVEGLPLRAEVGYSDGWNSDNTNFVDGGGVATYGAANPDWGAFARVEYLAMGNWKLYDDFTAWGNGEDLLVFGAGATYNEASGPGGADAILYTADVQYETGRLGLYGAYYGAYGEPRVTGNVTANGVNDQGFLAQAGYMLTDKWEVFGRYDVVMIDAERLGEGVEDTFDEITVGLNWYMKGHAAKFTVDFNYLPSGVPNDQNGIGYLDPDADESQFSVRSQFQLLL